MGPSQVASNIAGEMSTRFSKVPFLALVKTACGLQTNEVIELLDSVAYTQFELCNRFKVPQSKEQYRAVEAELRNRIPLAYWVVSNSIRATKPSPEPSDALASILIPIEELFNNRKLRLIPMLQGLQTLNVLHQNILDGGGWEDILSADFTFLEYINDHEPLEIARLLTNDDISCFRKFSPDDYLCPSSKLRDMRAKRSTLTHFVELYISNYTDQARHIYEITKHLIDGGNLFSGMAFLEGVHRTYKQPAELSKYWELLNTDNNYASYRRFRLASSGLPYLPPHLSMISEAKSESHKATVLSDLFQYTGFPGLLIRNEVIPGNNAELDAVTMMKGHMSENGEASGSAVIAKPELNPLRTRRKASGSKTKRKIAKPESIPPKTKRKKAKKACAACQRAHLTCEDERPCQRCTKRGIADSCQDSKRRQPKYLYDVPPEALTPILPLPSESQQPPSGQQPRMQGIQVPQVSKDAFEGAVFDPSNPPLFDFDVNFFNVAPQGMVDLDVCRWQPSAD
ncbi:hypothetical protein BJ875DRAFT_547373 [Amylocarpus encephaloides]|uniref:Zn(2)-C6 fungal-type domain-containing protein n=1 Tax=Amylocarpus encephaloides TaxID=45428 RepID=A0A9P7Y8B0_9HELO|nr:hypothetical protein BJ875DRAFT_547373 [Amylocarpus encephaloides]